MCLNNGSEDPSGFRNDFIHGLAPYPIFRREKGPIYILGFQTQYRYRPVSSYLMIRIELHT